jgi:hypothetical protein
MKPMRLIKYIMVLVLGLAGLAIVTPVARAQGRPYVGFAYPAGGQQGTTFKIRLGGQGLDGVNEALITGSGVTAKVVEYHRRLNNQEMQLLKEQLKILKQTNAEVATVMAPQMMPDLMDEMSSGEAPAKDDLIVRIGERIDEFVPTPASASISSLVFVEVKIAPDAQPGAREIRLATLRGVSNPLMFHVGQVPEFSRKPMLTATLQVLGKEAQALRKRPSAEVEDRITIPCTVNGQIASGEENRYRFTARKGQRLVLTTLGRQLIPFIADAVPGWFQPVLALYDADGKEVAYDDDYRFMPDPILFYEVPKDGEYVFAIHDSIYRGREDFVYRVTIGELPFVTGIFPLGGRAGDPVTIKMKGWNLDKTELVPPVNDDGPGIHLLTTNGKGFVSNRVPFDLDILPECFDKEPNNDPAHAQKVNLPMIVNGRIDRPDDWDVFQFTGKSNDTIVVEVYARRLDSPLDSVLKLTDAQGTLLAFNDDHADLGSGVNTHDADSYLMARLPADGTYYVHLGDTARNGGEAYAYRLRISAPQPDFALRVVPSSASLRSNATAAVTVHAIRRDGFTGPIKLSLKDTPTGFTSAPVTMSATQTVTQLTIKTTLIATKEPTSLTIIGSAKIDDAVIAHKAVPAEDRMQAFLWRHLVPAQDFQVVVFDPGYNPTPQRVPRVRPSAPVETNATVAVTAPMATVGTNTAATVPAAKKLNFTKQQITGRLKQLKLLYEEDLLTDDFYDEKVAECEAAR